MTDITELTLSQGETVEVHAAALGTGGTLALVNNASGSTAIGKATASGAAYIPARIGAPWGYGVKCNVTGVTPGADTLTLQADQAGEPTPDPIVTVSGQLAVTVLDAVAFVSEFTDAVTSALILPRPVYAPDGVTLIGVFIVLPTNTTGPVRAHVESRPVDAAGVAVSGCSAVTYESVSGNTVCGVYESAPDPGADLRGLQGGTDFVRVSCTNVAGNTIMADMAIYVSGATSLGSFTR